MITIVTGTAQHLPVGLETLLARYRHKVFIETLKWPLPDGNGLEHDQFDRDDTLYVTAQDASGAICGCARLLPTTRAYLLGEVFPEMLNGAPVPCAADVWELSRFATLPVDAAAPLSHAETDYRRRQVLGAAVQAVATRGATRLIMVTVLGVERLLRNLGVHFHRAGPPFAIDGKPTLALWLELDAQTRSALDLPPVPATVVRH